MDIKGDLRMITGLTIIGGIVIANVIVTAVGLMF